MRSNALHTPALTGRTRASRGFLLTELLVYIVGITVVLAAVTYFTVQVYGLYGELIAPSRADRVGANVVTMLSRELRSGSSVDFSESAFGVPTGFVTITAHEGEETSTQYFGLESGRLAYREDGGATSYLTPADLSVSGFTLTSIETAVSSAIRYELAITYAIRGVDHTRTYTGLTVLRHSYD